MSSEKDEPPELIPNDTRAVNTVAAPDGPTKDTDILDTRASCANRAQIANSAVPVTNAYSVKIGTKLSPESADAEFPSVNSSAPSASLSKDKAATTEIAHANSSVAEESDGQWCNVVTGGSLIPPTNFGIVEEDLYRSGMPNELNFPFLEQLQLKTVIYLASDEMSDKLADFMEDQSIELIHLTPDEDDMPAPWKPMSEEIVLSAMELLLDPSVYPIYVMCSQGRHRTGTVIGCLRKLQGWCLSSIFEEYHRHADAKGRLSNEQFIELFDTDLINIPSHNRPTWLR